MTYFDASLEAEAVAEQQSTPALPEERFVFELVGFERSEPDEYRAEGGVKWTWRVFHEDGHSPFVFNDEQYLFFRTTNIDKKTKRPLFTVGSSANDWAAALLGRTLGVDAHIPVPELRGKRFSAVVVWERQKRDKTKWSVKLATLRHVPVAANSTSAGTPQKAAPDVDGLRASLGKKIRQAEILGTPKHLDWLALDPASMGAESLQSALDDIQHDIDA